MRDVIFDDLVSVYLTLACAVYTRSIVAFRLTLVSDTSVDVAMLLRDVVRPLLLREGWGEDMEWPYPGVPAAVIAEFRSPATGSQHCPSCSRSLEGG